MRWMLILCCAFATPGAAWAQEEPPARDQRFGQFSAGLRLGVCASQIDGDNYGGYNKAGITGAAMVFTPVSKKTDLQLEIGYGNRGSRDPADPENGKFTYYRINLHYIDVPILVKVQTWKFKFEAGINNGILVGSSEEDEFGTVTNSIFNFNRYELAVLLGANVLITENWNFNVRYHRSVIPIANERELVANFGFLGGSYNDALSFSVIRYLRSKS